MLIASLAALEAPLTDPTVALDFDYCGWASAHEPETLPDFDEAYEKAETPEQKASLVLVRNGTALARASSACAKDFAAGVKLDEKTFSKALKKRGKAKNLSDDPVHRDLQLQLHEAWATDQAARTAYLSRRGQERTTDAASWAFARAFARAQAVDEANTSWIRETVESHGWIDVHRFGERFSAHAWILVQHADDHPEFQADMLEKMGEHLESGGVRKRDYAYLWDRVAVNHDRKQRYGTQPTWECDANKMMALKPIEDPDAVEALRVEMGMGTTREQLESMSRAVCGK